MHVTLTYAEVRSCIVNISVCWAITCSASVVRTLFLKMKPIILIRDKKHPLETNLMIINYSKYHT